MKTIPALRLHSVSTFKLLFGVAAVVLGVTAGPALRAAGAPPGTPVPVIYSPDTLQSAQGSAPFDFHYDLTVTSPASLPSGVTTTVAVDLAVLVNPGTSSEAEAMSYITSSVSSLNFTGPGQSQQVTIYLSIPVGSSNGDFGYKISTLGWPAGYNIVDNGTRINMHVNPPAGLKPPVVSIDSPAAGTTYTHESGSPAILVPIMVSGSATNSAVVTSLTATITGYTADGVLQLPTLPLSLVLTGLGTAQTSGEVTGGFPVLLPGVYNLTATAVNSEGTSTTTSTFTVDEYLVVVPPTVEITAPGLGATFPLSVASTTGVRMDFTGMSQTYGAVITQLTLQLDDGAVQTVSSTTLGQATAYGSLTLPVATVGAHHFTVTATDAYGTAVASSVFTVVDDTPLFSPVQGTVFLDANRDGARQSGEAGFSGVTVTLKDDLGATVATATTANDGSYAFSAAAGSYTVSAAIPAGYLLTTANDHAIVVAQAPVTAPDTGLALVPVNAALGGVVFYDANSNGVRNAPADTGLAGATVRLQDTVGHVLATATTGSAGTYSFTVAPGTYVIAITGPTGLPQTTAAPLPYQLVVNGTAVTAPPTGYGPAPTTLVSGTVFFDVNCNGQRNSADYGLGGISVKLYNASGRRVLATTTTADNGTYSFPGVQPGGYLIIVTPPSGFTPTTVNEWDITVRGLNFTAPDTGLGLDFCAIGKMCAGGQSACTWYSALDRLDDRRNRCSSGDASRLNAATALIGRLGLSRFDGLTTSKAMSILGCTRSSTTNDLDQQLLAAEYNYATGCYLNGSKLLSYAFIYWGEYVATNPGCYASSYLKQAIVRLQGYNEGCDNRCDDRDDRCDRDSRCDDRDSRCDNYDRDRNDCRDDDRDSRNTRDCGHGDNYRSDCNSRDNDRYSSGSRGCR